MKAHRIKAVLAVIACPLGAAHVMSRDRQPERRGPVFDLASVGHISDGQYVKDTKSGPRVWKIPRLSLVRTRPERKGDDDSASPAIREQLFRTKKSKPALQHLQSCNSRVSGPPPSGRG